MAETSDLHGRTCSEQGVAGQDRESKLVIFMGLHGFYTLSSDATKYHNTICCTICATDMNCTSNWKESSSYIIIATISESVSEVNFG